MDANPFDTWLKSLFGNLPPSFMLLIKECLRLIIIVLIIVVRIILIVIRIAYHFIVKGVTKVIDRALLVQKEKGGIVAECLEELYKQGPENAECVVMRECGVRAETPWEKVRIIDKGRDFVKRQDEEC